MWLDIDVVVIGRQNSFCLKQLEKYYCGGDF